MPRPKYILCCETRLVDKVTGMVSHINVVESLAYHHISEADRENPEALKVPIRANMTPILGHGIKLTVSALWTRDEGDDAEEIYEHELKIHRPGIEEPSVIKSNDFRFSSRFFRHDVNVVLGKVAEKSGDVRIESRIKQKSGGNWLSQEYPIPVEVTRSNATGLVP